MQRLILKWTILVTVNLKLSASENMLDIKYRLRQRLGQGIAKNFKKINIRWYDEPIFEELQKKPEVVNEDYHTILRIGGSKHWWDWIGTDLAKSSSESTEDPVISHIFTTNNNVNFNEIFSNSLAALNDDSLTTIKKQDDDFTLSHLPSQFAEFRPFTTSTTSTSSTTTPPPRFPKASHITKTRRTRRPRRSRTTPTTTTPSTTTANVKVLPLKPAQRGVLDLLFPAVRVKKFKTIFETFRRMLSYTF